MNIINVKASRRNEQVLSPSSTQPQQKSVFLWLTYDHTRQEQRVGKPFVSQVKVHKFEQAHTKSVE